MASIGQPFGASGTEHASGLVPDPGSTAGTTHYLREDSTFDVPPDVAIETITDGTNTVSPASSLSFADGEVSGSSPDAVYTPRVYEAGTGITLTPAGNTTTIESTGIETITDGTNTVSPANSLRFAAGVVTGTTPDAVYTPPTYTVFGPSGPGHSTGLVPDPGSTAGTSRALYEDGTWDTPPGHNIDTITDGTHTVAPADSLTFADGVISGSTPNAVYTPRIYTAGAGITLTPSGNDTAISTTPTGVILAASYNYSGSEGVLHNIAVGSAGFSLHIEARIGSFTPGTLIFYVNGTDVGEFSLGGGASIGLLVLTIDIPWYSDATLFYAYNLIGNINPLVPADSTVVGVQGDTFAGVYGGVSTIAFSGTSGQLPQSGSSVRVYAYL